jgi:alpha-L-rhamnosidase
MKTEKVSSTTSLESKSQKRTHPCQKQLPQMGNSRQHIGGLQMLEPGYKKSRIAPLVGGGGLSHGKCSLRTPYGLLTSEWNLANGNLTLAITVPANTSAEIVIPAANAAAVSEGTAAAGSAPGVKEAAFGNGQLTLLVGSGHYEFTSRQ